MSFTEEMSPGLRRLALMTRKFLRAISCWLSGGTSSPLLCAAAVADVRRDRQS